MSIRHEDLLALAKELCAGATETHWRAAVSRAYYSAYHRCQQWHEQLPAPGSAAGSQGGAHQTFINQLRNPAPEVKGPARELSKKLAAWLDTLKIQRHRADYSLSENVDALAACNATAKAEEMLAKL